MFSKRSKMENDPDSNINNQGKKGIAYITNTGCVC